MTVTFINAMKVPESQDARFLKRWDEGAAYVATQSGFVSTSLHKNAHGGPFQYYTVACWESETAFRAATSSQWWKAFTEEFGFGDEATGLVATPAVCEVVRDEQRKFA